MICSLIYCKAAPFCRVSPPRCSGAGKDGSHHPYNICLLVLEILAGFPHISKRVVDNHHNVGVLGDARGEAGTSLKS